MIFNAKLKKISISQYVLYSFDSDQGLVCWLLLCCCSNRWFGCSHDPGSSGIMGTTSSPSFCIFIYPCWTAGILPTRDQRKANASHHTRFGKPRESWKMVSENLISADQQLRSQDVRKSDVMHFWWRISFLWSQLSFSIHFGWDEMSINQR